MNKSTRLRHAGRKLAGVIAVFILLAGAATAIEINSSQAMKYYGNGNLDFRVDNQGNISVYSGLDMQGNDINSFFATACPSGEVVNEVYANGSYDCVDVDSAVSDQWVDETGDTMTGNLNMSGNNVTDVRELQNFFATACPDYVRRIRPDGSYECGTDNTGADAQGLPEVLLVNDTANQSIDMDGNALQFLGALYSDGGTTSFFSGGANADQTVTGINADGTLQTTSISVGSSNIQTDAVRDIELAANAVNASGGHLDSSVAGTNLQLNNGALDVQDGWIDEGTTDIGNALTWSGNVIYVDETGISHDNLTDVTSADHHTRPTAGNYLQDNSNTFDVQAGNMGWTDLAIQQTDIDVSDLGAADANLDMNGYNVLNPGEVDGVNLSDPGNALTVSGNQYAVQEGQISHDNIGGVTYNDHHGIGNGLEWDGSNNVAITAGGVGATELATGAVTNLKIAADAVNESQITSTAFGSGISGGSGSQITVGAGAGLQQNSGGLAVASNVALTDQQESISAAQWVFENNLTVQGDLDVWGNITNTNVNNLNVNGSILPPSGYDNQFDIGSNTRRWQNGYFGGSITIDSGLTVNGGTVSLPNNAVSNSELANSAITVNTGANLTGGSSVALGNSLTINHADTSSQGDVSGSGGTVLQTVNLDGNGHTTGMSTTDLDNRYYTESAANDTFVNEEDGDLGNALTWDTTNAEVDVQEGQISHDNIGGVTYNDHHGVGNGLEWDGSNNVAITAGGVGSNEIATGAVRDVELAANAVNASGSHLDSSVAGTALTLTNGQLDVADNWVDDAGDTMTGMLTIDNLGTALELEPSSMGSGDITRINFTDPDGGTPPMTIKYTDDGTAALAVDGGRLEVPNGDLDLSTNSALWENLEIHGGGATTQVDIRDGGNDIEFRDTADGDILRLRESSNDVEVPNGNLNMAGNNVDNVGTVSGNGGPVQVSNDVQMTGGSPEIDLGNGMSVQRTNGDVVISD